MSQKNQNRELERKLSVIAQHESRFNASVQRALACKHDVDPALLASVKSSFEELRARVQEEPTATTVPLTLEAVEKQAGRISRLRIYVLPPAEALNMGLSVISELKEWRVPQEVLNSTAPLLTDARGNEEPKARAAIHNLLFIRDSWQVQFRRYFDNVNWMTKRLTVLLVALAVATGLAQSFSIALAFVLAGLCGATASILMKPPVLTVFGESIGLFNRTIGRFAAGLVASAVGFGLLSSDLLTLNIGDFKSTAELVDRVSVCSGLAPQLAALLPGSVPPPALEQGLGAESTPLTAGRSDCTSRIRWVAFLLTLGLLFGFSERAVSSFEDMILARWSPPGR